MKHSKQFAARIGTALFMALVLCTVAAHRIELLLLTEVCAVDVLSGETLEDGSETVMVPPAAVFTDQSGESCVMLLRRREGTWGMETYVEKARIQVYREDYDYCVLKNGELKGQSLAAYPSRNLSDDETVRCVEK